MVTHKMIPLTRFADYVATAKAIQRTVGARGPTGTDLRQAVADLAGLAVKALEEAQQSIEGLAALLMALHPEVTRTRT
jgi:hypothetical protein